MAHIKTILTVRLILEKNKKLLFLKQTSSNGGGHSLVGGKIDHNEAAVDALIREAFEEVGIRLKKKHLQLIHLYRRDSNKEIIMVYKTRKWTGKPEPLETHKFKKTHWFSKLSLPTDISPTTNHILEMYLNKSFYSEDKIKVL